MNYCSENKLGAAIHNICDSNNKLNEIKSVTQTNKNFNQINKISYDDCLLEQCLFSSESFKVFFAAIKEQYNENRINLFISYCKYDLYNFNPNDIEYKKKMLLNLLLCLNILDSEGIFIIKLPESNSTFTLSIIYILYKFFVKVSLFKPFTSHNITSTRYFACIGLKNFPNSSEEFSNKIEELLINILNCSTCIDSLFETNFLKADNRFRNYIFEVNKDIDEKRINRLNEMLAEINNNNRVDYHKLTLKKELYCLWKLDLPEIDRIRLEELESGNHKKKPHTINDFTKTGKIKSITDDYNTSKLEGLFDIMEKSKLKKHTETKIIKPKNVSTNVTKKPQEKKENESIPNKEVVNAIKIKVEDNKQQVENTKVKVDQNQLLELKKFIAKKN